MNSIREQIIQAIFTRLETITVVNNYHFDVGLNANRAKPNLDENEMPALSLWPGTESTSKQYSNTQRKMVIDIESFKLLEDETLTNDAITNQMMADIQKCMGTYDVPIDGLIEGMQETNTEPIYPDSDSNIISVRVTYEITYMTVKGDPYLQP